MEVTFLLLHGREATQSVRSWHDYLWPWESLTWFIVLYNMQLWRHGRWFRKFTVRFRPIRKECESSTYMYNNHRNVSANLERHLRYYWKKTWAFQKLNSSKSAVCDELSTMHFRQFNTVQTAIILWPDQKNSMAYFLYITKRCNVQDLTLKGLVTICW